MIKNIAKLFSGNLLGQLIPLMVLPLVSHLYSPESFGIFSLMVAITSICLIVCCLRYEQIIVQQKNVRVVFGLFYVLVSTILIVSVLTFLTIVFLFETFFLFIPFMVFFLGINTLIDKVLNRFEEFNTMTRHRVLKPAIENSLVVLLGLASFENFGLQVSLIVSVISISLYLMNKLKKIHSFLPISRRLVIIGLVAMRRNISLPKYNLPHAITNTTVTYLPIILLPIYYEKHHLGLYAFGMKLLQAPLSVLGQSIQNVTYPFLASSRELKITTISNKLKQVLTLQFLVLFGVVIVIFNGQQVFVKIFGVEWEKSFTYILMMAPWALSAFIVSPYACIVNIVDKQKEAFTIELFMSTVKVITLLLAFSSLPIESALLIYSFINTTCVLVIAVWYFKLIRESYV